MLSARAEGRVLTIAMSPQTEGHPHIEAHTYSERAADAVRDALFDLLAYQQTYQATSADMRFIGVGWGQGLQPSPGSPVLLCTPDRIPDALALVD
jgi:hypothetical protein